MSTGGLEQGAGSPCTTCLQFPDGAQRGEHVLDCDLEAVEGVPRAHLLVQPADVLRELLALHVHVLHVDVLHSKVNGGNVRLRHWGKFS